MPLYIILRCTVSDFLLIVISRSFRLHLINRPGLCDRADTCRPTMPSTHLVPACYGHKTLPRGFSNCPSPRVVASCRPDAAALLHCAPSRPATPPLLNGPSALHCNQVFTSPPRLISISPCTWHLCVLSALHLSPLPALGPARALLVKC